MLFLHTLLFFVLAISVAAIPVSPETPSDPPQQKGIGHRLKNMLTSAPYEHNVSPEAKSQRINGIWKTHVLYKAAEGEPLQPAKICMLIQDGMVTTLYDLPRKKLGTAQGLIESATWSRVVKVQRFEQAPYNVRLPPEATESTYRKDQLVVTGAIQRSGQVYVYNLEYRHGRSNYRTRVNARDGRGSPQDVEDDIVLSDLVRGTGEASRLRRRGALRVDRVYTAVNRPSRWEVYVPYEEDHPGLVPEPPQQPSQSQQSQSQQQTSFALPFPVAPPLDLNRDENDEYTFVLRCGASSADPHSASDEHPHYLRSTDSSPFFPSLLPLYPPRPSSPQKLRFRPPGKQVSNGCGAIVHTKAAPRPKLGMWTAKTEASDSVVHLDPCYFDSAAVGKMDVLFAGVLISYSGNPLGTLYTPCKSATDGVFFAPPRSIRSSQGQPLQPQPQSPPQPQQPQSPPPPPPTSSPKLHVYSFFATAVSSHPPYKFPSSSSSSSSSSAGTAPPRHPYPIPPPTSLQPLSRLPYPGASIPYIPTNPNLLLNSYPYPASRGANSNPNPNPNTTANANTTATGNPNAYPGGSTPTTTTTTAGYSYPYPFSHLDFPSLRDNEEAERSISGDVFVDGLLQERPEGEFGDEEEEEEDGEDEEDADADEDEGGGSGGAEGGGEDSRLGGIWMTRPTARDMLRAPRMRRTFSSMGDRDARDAREGEPGFFFGRGYATASPVPLSDLGEDGGAAVADDGGEEEGEEDANEMGGEEEGDDESFTLDEEEYYDSSPEASPRLSVLQIRQDVAVEEDARPHSNGGFASSDSSSSSSDKAEST
ncbi:hypothetical protein F5887DRAFT_1163291 [Amanita rubescens]|nr:hypothetical protein F5887DRAFT_1163291 [Amanita rubescens]